MDELIEDVKIEHTSNGDLGSYWQTKITLKEMNQIVIHLDLWIMINFEE